MRNSLALVTVIIGTRPEAIKLAPVIKAFKLNNFFKVRVVLTGQHKELVDEVLDVFDIKYDLNIDFKSSMLWSFQVRKHNKVQGQQLNFQHTGYDDMCSAYQAQNWPQLS